MAFNRLADSQSKQLAALSVEHGGDTALTVNIGVSDGGEGGGIPQPSRAWSQRLRPGVSPLRQGPHDKDSSTQDTPTHPHTTLTSQPSATFPLHCPWAALLRQVCPQLSSTPSTHTCLDRAEKTLYVGAGRQAQQSVRTGEGEGGAMKTPCPHYTDGDSSSRIWVTRHRCSLPYVAADRNGPRSRKPRGQSWPLSSPHH